MANTQSQHACRAQAINHAKNLEKRTHENYRQGVSTLLGAVQEAVAARAVAASATARVSREKASRVLSTGNGRETNVGMRSKTRKLYYVRFCSSLC